MAAALSLNHAEVTAANVASLLDDELTSDVTFLISDKADVEAGGGSHHVTIRRMDADVGTGKAPRALAVVLDADFDDRIGGDGGGSMHSGSHTVLTAGRASRRRAAVAGGYAAAMRADAASDQSFQPPTFEFKGHRCIFAAASKFFRELLYRPTNLAASGDPRLRLPAAVTPRAFAAVRSYVYTGKTTVEIGNAVEVVAAAAVLGLDEMLREAVACVGCVPLAVSLFLCRLSVSPSLRLHSKSRCSLAIHVTVI